MSIRTNKSSDGYKMGLREKKLFLSTVIDLLNRAKKLLKGLEDPFLVDEVSYLDILIESFRKRKGEYNLEIGKF